MTEEKDYTRIIEVRTGTAPAENPNTEKKQPEIQYQEMSLLQRAIHFRDFEIEMSWKRAQYFTIFLSAIFIAYYHIKTGLPSGIDNFFDFCETKNSFIYKYLPMLLMGLGTLLSYIWYLVNRGSKQTYENWEHHIDCIEATYHKGVLYSNLCHKEKPKFYRLLKSYPISASKASNLVSLIITISFGVCFIFEIIELLKTSWMRCVGCTLTFGSVVMIICVFRFCNDWIKSSSYGKKTDEESHQKTIFYFHNRLTDDDYKYVYENSKSK